MSKDTKAEGRRWLWRRSRKRRDETRLRRWLRRLGRLSLAGVVALLLLWFAVHKVHWLGPAIADGLRSVLGPGPVAWMEDVAYGVQDRVNLWRYQDEAPTTFWESPAAANAAPPPADDVSGQAEEAKAEEPEFFPTPFQAPFASVATPADGIWVPIADPQDGTASFAMFKTVVHPDKRRGFAALAVIAIDLHAFELHLMAGTSEPLSNRVKRADRPGTVPSEHAAKLFAAFNGGFKTTHGQYGMMLNGVEFLAPRDIACTFARFRDGSFRIATWSAMKSEKDRMLYYRQTPPCLVEDGKLHKLLHYHEYAKGWGATVSGDTVIRRSSLGLDKEGTTLFYGLGEAMTAQSIARGMFAAGANDVVELDVNYSFPRFLFYERPDPAKPPIATKAIIPNIDFTRYQYVGQASVRDFFYLTRSSREAFNNAPDDGKLASK